MKLLHLEIADVKRIRAIEIDPATNEPIILTGDNAQGKSSVLDSIVYALSNTGLDDPIRHGRPSGSIKIVLGADKAEYNLDINITKKGRYLTLTDARGVKVEKPQTFLNGLLGNYAFDPVAFAELAPKPQVEALKKAAGLDFTELDARRVGFFNERTDVGRHGKDAKAQLDGMIEPGEGVPAEELSASALMASLRELEEADAFVSTARRQVQDAEEKARAADAEVSRLLALLESARAVASKAGEMVTEMDRALTNALAAAPTPEALAAAREAIEQVDKTNAAVRNKAAYQAKSKEVTELRAKYETLTRRIEEIDEAKIEAVKNADLPLDGLELTDDGVLYNGTFFKQLSTAEQIRISTLVAMAQNPELKIILIREGALINRANFKLIVDLAKDRDYQLWVEKFQEEPGETGLHIVDGAVAFEDGQAVSAE
jgi:predicted ATP-dependent endonuclease of OLD family